MRREVYQRIQKLNLPKQYILRDYKIFGGSIESLQLKILDFRSDTATSSKLHNNYLITFIREGAVWRPLSEFLQEAERIISEKCTYYYSSSCSFQTPTKDRPAHVYLMTDDENEVDGILLRFY
jgi:hypothetical protein